jgi:hypothetical protein
MAGAAREVSGAGSASNAGNLGPDVLCVARRILRHGQIAVGLAPLHAQLSLTSLARALGSALFTLGERVALLSPAWRVERGNAPTPFEPLVRSSPEGPVEAMLPGPPSPRNPLELELATEWLRTRYQRVIVDLAELAWRAEHASLLAALDAVLLVARVGAATERRMRALTARLVPEQRMGVLLLGG